MNFGLRTLLSILLPLAVILGGAGYLMVAFLLDAQDTRNLVFVTHAGECTTAPAAARRSKADDALNAVTP